MSNQVKDRIRWQQKELAKIIRSWELIPGAPANEFDSLAHQILSNLYSGNDENKIGRILESDLTISLGLFPVSKGDIESYKEEVMTWWKAQ